MVKPTLSRILRPAFSRRAMLKGGLIAGAGLVVAPLTDGTRGDSAALKKYVSRLPIPAIAQPNHIEDGVPHYRIEMTEFRRKVHPDLPPTTLWGYDGTWPGPTPETRSGRPVSVRWVNNLPTGTFSRMPTIRRSTGRIWGPHVRTVVHLHGANVWPTATGIRGLVHTGLTQTGPYFDEGLPLPNDQEATNLLVPRPFARDRSSQYILGLAGFYFIRDEFEEEPNLPQGHYEVPLLIQDRMFNADGSLQYPTASDGTTRCGSPNSSAMSPASTGLPSPISRSSRASIASGC